MKYLIKEVISDKKMNIKSDKFEKIKTSILKLQTVLFIEKKYNMIIENYRKFEEKLFEISLNSTLYSHNSLSIKDDISKIDLQLTNLLTVCKLYLDQVKQDIKKLNIENLNKKFSDAKSKEYDENIEYAFMYALRNHVQHKGLPVHRFTYKSGWVNIQDSKKTQNETIAQLNVEVLEDDD